jgi:hypothetical protein
MAGGIDVKVTGPLVREGARLTQRHTAQFVTRMLQLGEQRLHDKLVMRGQGGKFLNKNQAREGRHSVGTYRQSVKAYPKGTRGQIHDDNSAYGPWLESGKSRHGKTRFPGYFTFRETAQWMNKEVPSEARKFLRQLARKMNGA